MKTTQPILPFPAPPITTARLFLRPIAQYDLQDFHTMRTQIDVMIWTSTGKIDGDLDATQSWMNKFLPPNDKNTFNYAIEELSDPGRVIGVLGLPWVGEPEAGYMFRTEAWGKGYATEALKAWLDYYWSLPREEIEMVIPEENKESALDARPKGERELVQARRKDGKEILVAVTTKENMASQRVLSKCGFERVQVEEVEDSREPTGKVTLVTYHMVRPESN